MQHNENLMSAPTDRMSPEERRAGASLASIFALRMLGLFLILPVFSVYAKTCPAATTWRWSALRSAPTA
jgi:hypothetical protein